MIRDDAEKSDYYYFFNESEEHTLPTTVTLRGEVTPYVMDTWSGKITPMGQYRYKNGNTVFEISMAPPTVAMVLADRTEQQIHVTGTDADGVQRTKDGDLRLTAAQSGDYTVSLSSGKTLTTRIDVPNVSWDGSWTVSIDSWSQGEKAVYATEVRSNLDPYTGKTFEVDGSTEHTCTEYYYKTNKQTLVDRAVIANDDMVSWKDLYANGLVDTDLKAISGTGVYQMSLTLPQSWNADKHGMMLDLGALDSMVSVEVNGVKFRVDIDHCVVDISEALRAGVNTLTVHIATDLCNYNTKGQSGLKRGMQESAPYYPIVYREYPAPFGLTESVALIPYGTAAVTGVELTVEGPVDASLGQKGLTYTVTAKNAKALATATLTMAIENLGSPIVEAQNGWYIISCIYEDGILTVVTGNHAGVTSEEAATILTVTANAATVGTASVSIADAVLSAYTEEDEAFDSMVLADARVETKVDYSIYDVNRDGVANQLDLTRAQRFYGTADTVCDVDAAALWISRI